MAKNKKYIYESPDGGETLYRREFGNYNLEKRELVQDDKVKHSKYYYDFDRNKGIAPTSPQTREDEFKAIADAMGDLGHYGLYAELIWSSLKAMKESNGRMSILSALQQGKSEWDI
mgnify:CR=1 FL=1